MLATAEKFNTASKDDIAADVASFQSLLDAAKSPELDVKRFVGSAIPKYASSFPALGHTVINTQLDLCEDDDAEVRINAVRGLSLISQAFPDAENITRVADAIVQLLLSAEGELEERTLRRAFSLTLAQDFATVLAAVFSQLIAPADPELLPKAVAFVRNLITVDIKDELKDLTKRASLAEQLRRLLLSDAVLPAADAGFFMSAFLETVPRKGTLQERAAAVATAMPVIMKQGGLTKSTDVAALTGEEADAALDAFSAAMRDYSAMAGRVVKNFAEPAAEEVSALADAGVDFAPPFSFVFAHVIPHLPSRSAVRALRSVVPLVRLAPLKVARSLFPAAWRALSSLPTAAASLNAATAVEGAERAAASEAAAAEAAAALAGSISAAADAAAGLGPAAPKQEPKLTAEELPVTTDMISAEPLLLMVHVLGAHIPDLVQEVTGLAIPTGQPGAFEARASKAADSVALLKALAAAAEATAAAAKTAIADAKLGGRLAAPPRQHREAARKAAKAAAAATAVDPASAGQPPAATATAAAAAAPEDAAAAEADAAAAAEAAEIAAATVARGLKLTAFRNQGLAAENAAAAAESVQALIKPLLESVPRVGVSVQHSWGRHQQKQQERKQEKGEKKQRQEVKKARQQERQQQQQQQQGGQQQRGGQKRGAPAGGSSSGPNAKRDANTHNRDGNRGGRDQRDSRDRNSRDGARDGGNRGFRGGNGGGSFGGNRGSGSGSGNRESNRPYRR